MILKRLVFRSMRGQAFAHFFEIPPSESDSLCSYEDRLVFIIIYHEGDYAHSRLRKICEAITSDPVIDIKVDSIGPDLHSLRQ